MSIYHTVVQSPMGRLLVAATDQGVCSVKLGNSDPALEENLLAEFPSANHEPDGGHLAVWAAEILSYLDGEKTGLDLPLDIQATAFQQRVWQMLRTIPYGETRTYQQVAQVLGEDSSSRAVGTACGANPVALVIPCHRVLRKTKTQGDLPALFDEPLDAARRKFCTNLATSILSFRFSGPSGGFLFDRRSHLHQKHLFIKIR